MDDTNLHQTQQTNPLDVMTFGQHERKEQLLQQRRQQLILWCIFLVLLVIAAGVFFILPNLIPTPQAPQQRTVETAQLGQRITEISPFEEAQRLRARQEAQDALASLLEFQAQLEENSVTQWADEEFKTALTLATAGDESYRAQAYQEARDSYTAGSAALQEIIASKETRLNDWILRGQQALETGSASQAYEAFTVALSIDPDNADALKGLQRASVLDDVLGLFNAAEIQRQQGNYSNARTGYQEILKLDNEFSSARIALESLAIEESDYNFNQAMSSGYSALQSNMPAQAEEFFRKAEKLRPNSDEVAAALQQAQDMATTARLKVHMNAASAFEADEDWFSALREWQSAQAVDNNVIEVKQGVERSINRRDLEVFLTTAIDEPLRLVDESIYQQTQQLIRQLDAFDKKGPRLIEQVDRIKDLLIQTRQPVTVNFFSDDNTTVTLLKQSQLGQFTKITKELTPGAYVAVGTRPGYRDVRIEFILQLGTQVENITVKCEDKI
jgi:tetratricopeptide (TPR) repeat protein